jgi:UDP-N-acetylmuramoyl-tripeptide--D-alanyl-D-alanine ligase
MILGAQLMAEATGGSLVRTGPPGAICTDTRKIKEGDWFLTLEGDRFDAHDFLPQARSAGIAGAIARHVPEGWDRGFIEVPDTLQALQDIARAVRQGYQGPVVGITGSAGKTTTRAMVGLVLQPLGQVHQTQGNLNNHIGVPLTILDAPVGADVWVLEMGMNHLGEIDLLQEIGRPTIRVITNVGAAHLEGVGSIELVAQAKGELFRGARPGDTLCINADDPFISSMPIPEGVRVIRYGSSMDSDVRLTDAAIDATTLETRFRIQTPTGRVLGTVPSPGLHLAHNATAAVAIARALRVPTEEIGPLLGSYAPIGMRLRIEDGPGGIRVINDAYNANPMSTVASLESLCSVPIIDGARRIALLGDMLELGAGEIAAHREIIMLAQSMDLDVLGLVGPRFTEAAGADSPHLLAPDAASLARLLKKQLRPGDVVLLKGSRGLAMERVLSELQMEAPA